MAIETKLNTAKEELKDITAELLKETNSDIRDARLRATRRELRDEIAALEAELADTEADFELTNANTAEPETATKIETKHDKNGAILYYVNGKLVSRAIALEAATEKREGNLFTVEIGSWNEETKTVDYTTFMKLAECPVKIQQQAFRHDIGFRVIVSNVEVKTFYANKDNADRIKKARFEANVLANKIAMAFIGGEYGIRLIGGCDIKILEKPVIEADVEDYAVTTEAQDVAVEAEEDFAYMNELRAKHKAYRAEQLAKGNYTLDINGERIIFKNHKAFEIRAWKLGFGYSAERSKTYKFFELTKSGSFYRPASPKRIIDAYAKQLKDEELKSFADKFFAGSNTDKFFLVGCNLTIGKNEYSYRRDFNFFNQAKNFVYDILNNFAGKAEMYIFIQANKKFGKRYFTIDREGYMEENLPLFYSDYAKMSAAELTAKLAELNSDIKSQEEEVAYYRKHDLEADEEKQELGRLRLHRDEAEFALHADENRPCEQIVEDYDVTTDAQEAAIKAEENLANANTAKAETKMTIEKTITKNGTTIYYRVDSKGKKTRIDGTLGAFEYARENKLGGYREEEAQDVAIEAEENLANAHTAESENRDELQTLKAARDAAEKELDVTKEAEIKAFFAHKYAQEDADDSNIKLHEREQYYKKFGVSLVHELRQKFLPNDTELPITLHAQCDMFAKENPKLYISSGKDAFIIATCDATLARYDTTTQVELVIEQLKAAITRGDKHFTFPTVEQLTYAEANAAKAKTSVEDAEGSKDDGNDEEFFNIEPEPDTDSPEYMLGIINELDTINANAPDGWQVDFNPVENNFSVAFNGASVADIDSLALAKILPPDKFFDRFKPIIDDDRQEFYREDLPRELDELQAMREQLGDDKERLKTLDELIEQTKREIAAEVLKIPRESPSAII